MAKNLRESVECFGKILNSSNIYYRGIKTKYLFNSNLLYFNAPTSTTNMMSKAEGFMDDYGIVLTLHKVDDRLTYFDCSTISDHPNESEALFIGGLGKLRYFLCDF